MRFIIEYVLKIGGMLKSRTTAAFVYANKSAFAKDIGQTLATRIFIIGCSVVTSVLVARQLGPTGRGMYAVAMTIGALGVQLGNLGLPVSNTHYVAREPRLLPTLIYIALIISFIFCGILCVLTGLFFYVWPVLAPLDGFLLALSLLWIPFGIAYALLQNLLIGVNEIRTYNMIEVTNQISTIILLGIVIFSAAVRVETVFAVSLISLIASFYITLKALKNHSTSFSMPYITQQHLAHPRLREIINYGLKAYIASIFSALVFRIDLLMIKHFLGDDQAGYYSVAVTISNMLLLFPSTVGMLLFPKLSSAEDARDKWRITLMTAMSTGIIMLSICIFIFFLGKDIIVFFFGTEFEPSYKPLIYLVIGILIWSIEFMFRLYLNSDRSKGYRKAIIVAWFIALLLNILLNTLLIPAYGISGSAIAFCLSLFFVCFIVAVLTFKEYKMSLKHLSF